MANIFDRLQFVKHEEVFSTREEAIGYVEDLQNFTRPSLLAEPMVLLYGDEEKPNVILAIGSVGDGETASNSNATFFIDFQKAEEEIAELDEKIEKAIKALTLLPIESNTIELYSEKTDDGTFISGDVKVESVHVFDDKAKENNILVSENGLFFYVDVLYNEENDSYKFVVSKANGTLKEVKIPNNYLVDGTYDKTDESIHLTMKEGEEIVIDCEDLIAEWAVEGEDSNTPIVLTREEVDYDHTDEHHHVEPWQDVLRADVRVYDEDDNILKKVSDGRELYVGGKAENIAYYKNNGDRSTVKEQLDRIKLNPDGENVIFENSNGFFASVKLDYITSQNKLVFTTSKVSGGSDIKEIQLSSLEFLEDITYDSDREMIVIRYKTAEGEYKTIEIPAKDIIEEWRVDNENHNISLDRIRNSAGTDTLSADAKIHNGDSNILEDKDHTLYVRGEADNIKYRNNSNVEAEIDALKDSDSDINTRIDNEISRAEGVEDSLSGAIATEKADREADVNAEENRAKAAETVLENKIGTGFTEDPHENVTYKFNELQTAISNEVTRAQGVEDSLSGAIATETSRAEGVEDSLSGAIATEKARAEGVESNLQNAITNEETRATAEETTLNNKIGTGFTEDPHENVTYKFNELQTAISDEVTRAQGVEEQLQDAITDETANREADVDAEENRAKAVETIISGDVNALTSRVDSIETNIGEGFGPRHTVSDAISGETSRAETAENELQEAINNEGTARTNADEELRNAISDITLRFDDSNTIDFDRDITDDRIISANVKTSSISGNIISIESDGILSTVDLVYNTAENKLFLKRNGLEDKEIQLSAGSIIESITYDKTTQELTIHYRDAQGREQEVHIDVTELFNMWDVRNLDEGSAIHLEKNSEIQEGKEVDILTARAIISPLEDNLLKFDTNGLYVPTSAISGAIECTKNEIKSLKHILGGVEFDDCSDEGEYIPDSNTYYITNAQSFRSADNALDKAIHDLANTWFFDGSDTPTANFKFELEDELKKGLVTVRLSHGDQGEQPSGQTDDELTIKTLDDDYFTNTNVLKFVNVNKGYVGETLPPNNKYNGLYLSNIWECGEYLGDNPHQGDNDPDYSNKAE